MNELENLIEQAQRALGYQEFAGPDGAPRHVQRKPAAVAGPISLRAIELAAFPAVSGLAAVHGPAGEAAGRATQPEIQAIASRSRVVAAGASLVALSAPGAPVQPAYLDGQAQNAGIALRRREASFTIVRPPAFALVADGADVGASSLPIFRTAIDWDEGLKSWGLRFELSRADRREHEGQSLADQALAAIIAGCARAADACLLQAIAASTPGVFSIGAMASKGLTVSEVRALVGTSGTGASFNASGTLVAGPGVVAETTQDSAGTYLGAFGLSGVAIDDHAQITVERIGRDGKLAITAWLGLQPLLPDADVFWTAA